MRTIAGWTMVGCLVCTTSLLGQEPGSSTRRTLGAPLTGGSSTAPRPSAVAPSSSPTTVRPANQPASTGFGISSEQPAASTPSFQNSEFTFPSRSRVDTASRFEASDAPVVTAPAGENRFNTQMIPTSPRSTEVVESPAQPMPSLARPAPASPAPAATVRSGPSTIGATTTPPRNPLPSNTPAIATRPRESTPAEAASPVAEMLLVQSLEPRRGQELPGQALALKDVLSSAGSRGQRTAAVQAYWRVAGKVATYHAAVDDRALLGTVNARTLPGHERATLTAAQMAAEAAVQRAKLEFINAQQELVSAAMLSQVDAQPLPSNVPLVGEYRTHFAALQGQGAASSSLRRLDRAMPYHLQHVRAQADAVVASQQAVQAALEAVSTGEASVASLLEAQRLLAGQRSAFLGAVYDYNASIAEYALQVAPATESRDTLVGMLIKTKAATATASASGIRRVSAQEPIVIEEYVTPLEPLPLDSAEVLPIQEEAAPYAAPPRYEFRGEPQSDEAEETSYGNQPQLVPSATFGDWQQ